MSIMWEYTVLSSAMVGGLQCMFSGRYYTVEWWETLGYAFYGIHWVSIVGGLGGVCFEGVRILDHKWVK